MNLNLEIKDYVLIYELINGGYWIVKKEEDCLLLLDHVKNNGFNDKWYIHRMNKNTKKYFEKKILDKIPEDIKLTKFQMARINGKTLCAF